jgi:hypothetical protein
MADDTLWLYAEQVQVMIAAAIQLEGLHRQAVAQGSPMASEIGRVAGLIHAEALKLRERMREARKAANERVSE